MDLEKAKQGNCTNEEGHVFRHLDSKVDAKLKNEVLHAYPRMRGIGIWQCTQCNKVTASM